MLPLNKNIKFIGLEDNRISMGTLMEIESILKTGQVQDTRAMKHSSSMPNNTFLQTSQPFFPISADDYPSMDVQLRAA